MDDSISRQKAIGATESLKKHYDGRKLDFEIIGYNIALNDVKDAIRGLPSEEPEWNNHKVACLLAEMFGEDCACNFNGIDEWLPEKCEVIDSCPNPVGVACWEQFLKHRAERKING